MAARVAFACLIAVVVFQVLMWESHATAIRRDAPSSNASQTIDDALNSFKSSLDDFVKKIQENELFQNVSQSLKNFGDQVSNQTQQLVQKIQTPAKPN